MLKPWTHIADTESRESKYRNCLLFENLEVTTFFSLTAAWQHLRKRKDVLS